MSKSKISQLGYTFWIKDWRSNRVIDRLSFDLRGFYREIIDECYVQQSVKWEFNFDDWSFTYRIEKEHLILWLKQLDELNLIEFKSNEIIVPSVEKRLIPILSGKQGGKGSGKGIGKGDGNQTDKDKETDKDKRGLNDSLFSKFKEIYPKEAGTQRTEQAFYELTKDEREQAVKFIPKYVAFQPDYQFQKKGHAYLEARIWLDKFDTKEEKTPKLKKFTLND